MPGPRPARSRWRTPADLLAPRSPGPVLRAGPERRHRSPSRSSGGSRPAVLPAGVADRRGGPPAGGGRPAATGSAAASAARTRPRRRPRPCPRARSPRPDRCARVAPVLSARPSSIGGVLLAVFPEAPCPRPPSVPRPPRPGAGRDDRGRRRPGGGPAHHRCRGRRRGPRRRRHAARPGLGARRRRRRRAGRRRHRGRAQRDPALRRARARPGRAAAAPRRQARHRPARSRTASTTTSTSRSRSPRTTSTKLETAMKKIIKSGQRFSRRALRLAGRGPQGAGRRAVQAGADRPQGRHAPPDDRRRGDGGRRVRRAHHLRQPARAHRRGRLERPLPRPARAHHPLHPGVQAHAHRGRVLAGQREEPAAAAHLRHRVGDARRRWRRTCTGSPRPSGATTAGSAPSWTCSPSRTRSARASRSSTPRAASIRKELEDYSPAPPRGGGLRVRQHPAHHQGPAVRDLRATWTGTPRACTRPCTSTRS